MMAKTSVILFGSLGIAVECLRWLLMQSSIEVLGVVCSQEPKSKWREIVEDMDMQVVAPSLGVKLLTLNDVLHLKADLGLSVRFHQILREAHLNQFRLGVLNLHGAPLPEMRGSMSDTAAIIEGRTEFGTSLHWMNSKVDAGDIVAVRRFPIKEEDTVYDLFIKCNNYGLALIKENLDSIIQGTMPRQSQQLLAEQAGVLPKVYRKQEVLQCKEVSCSISQRELWNVTRAFQFPGHEPAYINTPNGRITLHVQQK